MSFCDFLENELLDHVFGNASYSAPATLYIGLSTTSITDAGGNITEPGSGAYARVAVTNNATNFPAASGGSKSNGTAITFPTATAGWGTITHFFIADAASSGNVLAASSLTASKTILTGDIPTFAIGALTFSLD